MPQFLPAASTDRLPSPMLTPALFLSGRELLRRSRSSLLGSPCSPGGQHRGHPPSSPCPTGWAHSLSHSGATQDSLLLPRSGQLHIGIDALHMCILAAPSCPFLAWPLICIRSCRAYGSDQQRLLKSWAPSVSVMQVQNHTSANISALVMFMHNITCKTWTLSCYEA